MMKTKVRQRGPIIVMIVFVLFSGGCVIDPCGFDLDDNHSGRYTAEESFEYEIQVDTQSVFRVMGINGSIQIECIPGQTSVEICGEKIVRSESVVDAEAHLSSLKVEITKNQSTVFMETVQPTHANGRQYQVNYLMRLPESWEVFLENTNGDVALEGLVKKLNVGLTNGCVRLAGSAEDYQVRVTNGNVFLEKVHGNIGLGITNGKVVGDMVLPEVGSCGMSIVNGEISLEIPKTTSASVSGSVTNGSISVSDLEFNNLTSSKHSITGTLGLGDGLISLTVVNGAIVLSGSDAD